MSFEDFSQPSAETWLKFRETSVPLVPESSASSKPNIAFFFEDPAREARKARATPIATDRGKRARTRVGTIVQSL